eukprot:GCRY01000883.1.p1 GENE.GCRY01000883.1~~GCRY01000883.1.p1  ORF type:complete len:654 (+),score=163.66 GCRY01000883.1:118-2079(+)
MGKGAGCGSSKRATPEEDTQPEQVKPQETVSKEEQDHQENTFHSQEQEDMDMQPESKLGVSFKEDEATQKKMHKDEYGVRMKMNRQDTFANISNYNPHKHSSRLEQHATIDIFREPYIGNVTRMICTIGPSCNDVETLKELRQSGMNIARLNFSHGSHEQHAATIRNLRESTANLAPKILAIALDTKGPEIRTGLTKDGGEIQLTEGDTVTVTSDDAYKEASTSELIYVDYGNICGVIEEGDKIFIDDGLVSILVEAVDLDNKKLTGRVQNTAAIGSRKGVNLPNVDVDLPALSEKDKADLKFGVEQGVDFIFASFIRSAQDVRDVKSELGQEGATIQVIAKIENHQGIHNFREILRAADGIMVARGDLGIEIPAQKVFQAQKAMIAQANIVGKPIICATQMLESMIVNPRPTRAEVSDVANAVIDGCDAVMLSGETAKGKYPVQAARMMREICREAEKTIPYIPRFNDLRSVVAKPTPIREAISSSAVNTVLENDAAGLIVLTRTGDTARLIAKYRPGVPILAVIPNAELGRKLVLHHGIIPIIYPYQPHHHLQSVEEIRNEGDADAATHLSPKENPQRHTVVMDVINSVAIERPTSALRSTDPQSYEFKDTYAKLQWAMQQGKKMHYFKPGQIVVAVKFVENYTITVLEIE